MERYIHYIDRRIPLETSRGCPYSCTYCDVKISMGQAFRPRSAEHILGEIKYFYDKGFRFFEFVDDVFTMDIERAKKVCRMILDSGMKFRWNCANGIRADRVDEELLVLMKKAGCEFVAYGLETGNPDMLKIIKKAITLEKATETFHLTRRIGLKFAVNFIIGHQEETFERAMDSIKYASSIPADYVNFSNMIPYPGTEVYKWIEEHEKTGRARFLVPKEEFLKNSTTKLGLPVFETNEFRYDERVKALKLGRALAKKTHLQYRMGKTIGSLVYQVSRNDNAYNTLRRFATGTHIGKKIYNKYIEQLKKTKDMNYAKLYSGEHLKKINPKWTFNTWSYRHTFVAKMQYIEKTLSHLPKHKKTLDAGCGQGLLVEEFKRRGHDIVGIDAFYGSEYVKKANILQSGYKENTFDVILCLDVIEHFPLLEQEKLIKELVRITKPGGIIIWSIPK